MAMCYVDRVLSLTGMYLLPRTWRRIILGAIILASKSTYILIILVYFIFPY